MTPHCIQFSGTPDLSRRPRYPGAWRHMYPGTWVSTCPYLSWRKISFFYLSISFLSFYPTILFLTRSTSIHYYILYIYIFFFFLLKIKDRYSMISKGSPKKPPAFFVLLCCFIYVFFKFVIIFICLFYKFERVWNPFLMIWANFLTNPS